MHKHQTIRRRRQWERLIGAEHSYWKRTEEFPLRTGVHTVVQCSVMFASCCSLLTVTTNKRAIECRMRTEVMYSTALMSFKLVEVQRWSLKDEHPAYTTENKSNPSTRKSETGRIWLVSHETDRWLKANSQIQYVQVYTHYTTTPPWRSCSDLM